MLIAAYNPDWPKQFDQFKKRLLTALKGIEVTIEHIGSTAVPYLAAKPIIDIDIIYNLPSDFNHIKPRLEENGYYHNGDQGITGREVFKRTDHVYTVSEEIIPHHLYVCLFNSEELSNHILFRNYLRNNVSARLFYQQLKYDIAAEAMQQKKRYAAIKELKARPFITSVIDLAKSGGNFSV